ncbi:WD40 repeat domain-containing protein [Photobacterium sp. 53610]|uniref:WD40 repeat domain-containing protein n=1 Tax=Photobacterium sp. 53610 TaxID=3102789 RepID=UPI002ED8D9A3
MRHIFIAAIFILTLISVSGCDISGPERQRWDLAPQGATAFSLSRDGRFALFYSAQQGIVLWDLQQNKKLASLGSQDPHHTTVTNSDISDNHRYAITATAQNFAIWDLAWGQAQGLWSISDGIIRDATIANDGKQVLLALSNGKALYVNLGNGRRLEFLAHREKVNSVAISPNGHYALSGGDDKRAFLWDTQTGQILYQFEHTMRVNQVSLQRDGKLAMTADSGNEAFIWNLTNGQKQASLNIRLRQQNFSSARFSDDGLQLATGTPSRRVELWNTVTGNRQGYWQAATQENERPGSAVVYDVAITPLGDVRSGNSAGIAQDWHRPE